MNLYVQSLFFAIPIFISLILIEMVFAKYKGIKINNSEDMISSLSSGMSNTIKDAIKFSFVIISYTWLVDNLTLIKIESLWLSVVIAFIVQDFAGYWSHRLSHRVNFLWNRHLIHHSSEEFNLSCALRQSISDTVKFFTFLWIPAAVFGIPAKIFAIIAPIHLFLQFWYHTRLIGKMGILEYFIVTPSHHRVHHAINPEYIDKNYGQIFIIWDKIFGTFQKELDHIKPVYGILRPTSTWNPVIINFKHIIQLTKDCWNTTLFKDKIKIWFMPTGWRPKDVIKKYPLLETNDPFKQDKYRVHNSINVIFWGWFQLIITGFLMFHLFIIIPDLDAIMYYLYSLFLLMNIFSFTSILDNKKYAVLVDLFKLLTVSFILLIQDFSWYGLDVLYSSLFFIYIILSTFISFYFSDQFDKLKNIKA